MGGNGAGGKYDAYALDTYLGDRFKEVGRIDGDHGAKVLTTTTKKTNSTPMNNFTSRMYYITKPGEPNQITTIAFYNKRTHKIYKSIDLKYDKQGNLVPFSTVTRKGKLHTVGTHCHKWPGRGKSNAGRVQHDPKCIFAPTKAEMRYINKALKYNAAHKSN